MAAEVNPSTLRRAAMDLLARREHARAELTRKMERRFGRESEVLLLIQAELDRLESEGLLCDQRFAEAQYRQLLNRGAGPRKIAQQLNAKGVSGDWLGAQVSEVPVDWQERAREVYQKKFGGIPFPDDWHDRQRERARRARFLQQRGFSPDHFMGLLDTADHGGNEESYCDD